MGCFGYQYYSGAYCNEIKQSLKAQDDFSDITVKEEELKAFLGICLLRLILKST